MQRADIVGGLARVGPRPAGSDAERRAAVWLRDRLRTAGRGAHVQTTWVRPRWALVHALHAALAVVGTLLAATVDPAVGAPVLAVALLGVILDLRGLAPTRLLTPRRATQNVVSPTPPSGARRPVRLVVCAGYDTPPDGLLLRRAPRRLAAALQAAGRGHGPGPLGVLTLAITLLLALAIARWAGAGSWTSTVSALPAAVCVVATFALLDVSPWPTGRGGGPRDAPLEPDRDANAAGLAVELVAALDAVPPTSLSVELVLLGAGHGPALGARDWVRRQHGLPRDHTIVLNLAPAAAGTPVWTAREGVAPALRYHPRLVGLCAATARARPELGARGRTARWVSGGLPARQAGFAAISLGGDPRADARHRGPTDPAAAEALLDFALELVDAIDDDVTRRQARPAPGAR